jgi:hypothetical protein
MEEAIGGGIADQDPPENSLPVRGQVDASIDPLEAILIDKRESIAIGKRVAKAPYIDPDQLEESRGIAPLEGG